MNNLKPTITEQGLQAVFNASNDGLAARISQIGLGDAGYSVAVSNSGRTDQTSLVSEQQKVAVSDGKRISGQQINISFIAEGTASYWVKELGFYLEDGTLFAVWSSPDKALAWKSDSVPLIVGLELVLSALPADSVTVEPGAQLLELVMTRESGVYSEAIIRLQEEQFQQCLALETLKPLNARADGLEQSIQNLSDRIPRMSVHTYYPPAWSYSTTNTNKAMRDDIGLLYSVDFVVPKKSIIIARVVGHWLGPTSGTTEFSMTINGQGGAYEQGTKNRSAAQHSYAQQIAYKWRQLHHSIMAEVPAGAVKIGLHMSSTAGSASINGSSINYTIIEVGE